MSRWLLKDLGVVSLFHPNVLILCSCFDRLNTTTPPSTTIQQWCSKQAKWDFGQALYSTSLGKSSSYHSFTEARHRIVARIGQPVPAPRSWTFQVAQSDTSLATLQNHACHVLRVRNVESLWKFTQWCSANQIDHPTDYNSPHFWKRVGGSRLLKISTLSQHNPNKGCLTECSTYLATRRKHKKTFETYPNW